MTKTDQAITAQPKIRTQLELPPKLHRWITREAKETGNSRSYVMRMLMVEAIRARQAKRKANP